MKLAAYLVLLLVLSCAATVQSEALATNPRIDAQAFIAVTQDALRHRAERRVDERDFLRMSAERSTVVLDARSSEKYRELHVAGAINLSFPDITAESLAQLIPDKNTRILIYCNNNFTNAEKAFPTKLASASLNLSTFAALYNYGYRNVFELGPLLDAKQTRIALISTR
jgi:phage shock protein E